MAIIIEVTGEWAGEVDGWRPAIAGALNQTAFSDLYASTFSSREEAKAYLETLRQQAEEDADSNDFPRFRLRDTENRTTESV